MKNAIRDVVRGLAASALILLVANANAEEQTLFGGKDKLVHGGFGAPVLKMTDVDGHSRLLVGAEGAWIVNHGFYLGLGGYGMSKGINVDERDSLGNNQYLHMAYGGLITGYTFYSDHLFHFGVQQMIGGGAAGLSTNRYNDHDENDDEDDEDCDFNGTGMFVWEPQLNAEMNVTKFMRLAVGAGYRYTHLYEEVAGYEDNDLGGVTGSVAVKFGKF